ncbi:hypothetical protein LCER1_G004710 [Lachnellula cervina]|uniref:Uncharacterized protein n=1 Tax=Lachnellula cervina TaxID=1316786 RepID=A0A7D8Z469_9HELO|nr:hypothetical protein LCER1_G004710 [Lachnellula cervina]
MDFAPYQDQSPETNRALSPLPPKPAVPSPPTPTSALQLPYSHPPTLHLHLPTQHQTLGSQAQTQHRDLEAGMWNEKEFLVLVQVGGKKD